jgi:hypothetical protein
MRPRWLSSTIVAEATTALGAPRRSARRRVRIRAKRWEICLVGGRRCYNASRRKSSQGETWPDKGL